VYAAGKQHVQFFRTFEAQQRVELLLPEHEAEARADVAAALTPFEHEVPRAIAQEQFQQAGRGHVQVGGNAHVGEGARLRRTAAGQQQCRRPEFAHEFELRFEHFRWREAEHADAPGLRADLRTCFLDQRAAGLRIHQRQG
jgi:hypothetical protein